MVYYQVNYCHDLFAGKILRCFPTFEAAQQFALLFISNQLGFWYGYSDCDSKGRVDLWVQGKYWVEILKNY